MHQAVDCGSRTALEWDDDGQEDAPEAGRATIETLW
jgi:hypothetical protein